MCVGYVTRNTSSPSSVCKRARNEKKYSGPSGNRYKQVSVHDSTFRSILADLNATLPFQCIY